VQDLPKTIAIFILWKGIINLHEACEEAQIIERDLIKYPLTLPPFPNSNNTQHDESKSFELEIVEVENQVKHICHRYLLLQDEIHE
jgi:hypothetical protein